LVFFCFNIFCSAAGYLEEHVHNARGGLEQVIIKRCALEQVIAAERPLQPAVRLTLLPIMGVLAKGRTKPVVERQIAKRESVELRVLQA
jgi:hypothetical protein